MVTRNTREFERLEGIIVKIGLINNNTFAICTVCPASDNPLVGSLSKVDQAIDGDHGSRSDSSMGNDVAPPVSDKF